MQENTNKAIAVNSVILYIKMGITTICGLFTTRFALQALGIADFGLFSVLGGIISFIGIFNTIMVSTSNRYLAVSIGKGNLSETNRIFNVNLCIFLALAIFMLIISYPIGDLYVHKHINYCGNVDNAMMVFVISVAGAIISSISTPFYGLLVAHEKFIIFSLLDIISHIVKCVVALLLISHFENKLLIYTVTLSLMTAMPTIVEWLYCHRKYYETIRWKFVKDWSLYKEIFSFSGWVAYGAVACVAKSQGAAILVNAFFDTVMNTALGLANNVGTYIGVFAQNVTQPISPQISKSYASGDHKRTDKLLIFSTKFSFLLMLLISSVFLVEPEWILHIWLGDIPPYAVSFTTLVIIDYLVGSFNSGISVLIFASGKIKLYQVLINTLRLMSLAAAYFVLKYGFPAESLLITYIIFSILIVISTQFVLHKTLMYDNWILFKNSYLPSLTVLLLFLPILLLKGILKPYILIVVTLCYLSLLIYYLGLSKQERGQVRNWINNRKVFKHI